MSCDLSWAPLLLAVGFISPLTVHAEGPHHLDQSISISAESRPNDGREVEAKSKNDLGVGLQQQAEHGRDPVHNLERASVLFQEVERWAIPWKTE